MAQLEIAKFTSPVYSYTFTLAGGTFSTTNVLATYNASPLARFFPQSSKILGLSRSVNVNGAQVYLTIVTDVQNPNNGWLPILTFRSQSTTDASTYTLYWTNETANSQLLTLINC
jgi:hypothetical protein